MWPDLLQVQCSTMFQFRAGMVAVPRTAEFLTTLHFNFSELATVVVCCLSVETESVDDIHCRKPWQRCYVDVGSLL